MRGFIQFRFGWVLGAGTWLSFGGGMGAGGAISKGN